MNALATVASSAARALNGSQECGQKCGTLCRRNSAPPINFNPFRPPPSPREVDTPPRRPPPPVRGEDPAPDRDRDRALPPCLSRRPCQPPPPPHPHTPHPPRLPRTLVPDDAHHPKSTPWPLFNAAVARLVTKKQLHNTPAAMQALQKEAEQLQARNTWDLTSVREWSEVAKEAKRQGKKAHVGWISR